MPSHRLRDSWPVSIPWHPGTDMTVTEKDGRTFDWQPRFDPRSLAFRAAPGVTEMPTTGRIWQHGPVLDQGAEGACVGFACAGLVAAEPSDRRGVNDSYARNWYRRAQRLDQWPGETYSGTSVLAGCLVGRERRLWAGFRWAKTPAELAAGILNPDLGPAMIGIQWSPDLYDVPASGVLDPDVRLDPTLGHAVDLFGYVPARALVTRQMQDDLEELGLWEAVDRLTEPSFLLLNSWNDSWGAGGRAVVPLALMRRWIAARGEFALPEGRMKGAARMTTPGEQTTEDDAAEQETQEQTTEGAGGDDASPPAGDDASQAAADDGTAERAGDATHHISAADVQDGDRLLDPPEALGQESVTVRGAPRMVSGWNGRRVTIDSTAGTFQLGAADPVTVRRSS